VVAVLDGGVAAAGTVLVRVIGVRVRLSHDATSNWGTRCPWARD
jgi:hypothetical protein